VISGIAHLARLPARFVFAREGVFSIVDPRPLPLTGASALRLARLFEKSTGGRGAQPARRGAH